MVVGMFVLLSMLFVSPNVFAADFYIAQTAAGSANGTACADAYAVTWFNTTGSWANPKVAGKVGPGDTVHLCGTVSSPLSQGIAGSSGTVITILWEQGAVLSLDPSTSTWNSIADMAVQNYTLVDGGGNADCTAASTPWSCCTGAGNGTCTNGTIEFINNGDALSHQIAGSGILVGGISNVEIKNLTIQNLYVHTPGTTTPVDLTTVGAIYGNPWGSNISVHNNTFHDICWVLNASAGGTGINIYNNYFYNFDHGLGGFPGANGMNVYNNHFGTTAIWDTSSNQYHHDGIHFFWNTGGSATGVNIYNNLFDGNWGVNNTAHIFFECDWNHPDPNSCTNFNVFNNVHIQYAGNMLNDGFVAGGSTNFNFRNNTYIGSGVSGSIGVGGLECTSFKNNVISGVATFTNFNSFSAGSLNNNIYANPVSGAAGLFEFNGAYETTLAAWKTATGQDGSSSQVSTAGLSSTGVPQAGAATIGAGTNLTSLGIAALNSDITGSARPATGAWDIGAYVYTGAVALTPPTGLHLISGN